VQVYELDAAKRNRYSHMDKDQILIRTKKVDGGFVYLPIGEKPVNWVERLSELDDCAIYIDAINDDQFDIKNEYIQKLQELAKGRIPILSDALAFTPAQLSFNMRNSANFAVSYFLDIEYMKNTVEFVVHKNVSEDAMERAKAILKDAKFACYTINECPGFIHNRISGLGILNLLKLYDEKVLSYSELEKYLIVTKTGPQSLLTLSMGEGIKTEMITLPNVYKAMNAHYGRRYYIPRFFDKEGLTPDTIADIIAADSCDYAISEQDAAGHDAAKEFNTIYVSGMQRIHSTFLSSLLRKSKKLVLDSRNDPLAAALERDNLNLHTKLLANACFLDETVLNQLDQVDMVMDFHIETLEQKIARVNDLQSRFGADIPIVLNTPIYKIEDIAAKTDNPAMVFGMYTIKNYLLNTEIVLTALMDRAAYIQLRSFLHSLCQGSCIETKDIHVRPLIFMVVPKLLECVRLIEEGVTGKEEIERLGVDGAVFKYMDLFGLDLIVFIADYLEPIYGDAFKVPDTLRAWVKAHEPGQRT
jgi:3-hydroxyacyl-CoA dehydrogenase